MSENQGVLLAGVEAGQDLPDLAYDVSASTVVLGALASRDWRPMHHDHDFAVNRNGVQDIFLNTPNQAAGELVEAHRVALRVNESAA